MTVRIGVLGAARIVAAALLEPAAQVDGVEVVALAARDPERAAAYAAEHGIARVLPTYEALVEDPEVDAVYVALPAVLHGPWVLRAVAAGKHVLCEKPFTANGDEAAAVAAAVRRGGVVVMEAFHSAHHPLWQDLSDLLASGRLGVVETAWASFCHPVTDRADIRWQPGLAGGALMDLGVYPLRLLTHLFGTPRVVSAVAEAEDGVDGAMTAVLDLPGDVRGTVVTDMLPDAAPGAELRVDGSAGSLAVHLPYHPQLGATITLTDADGVVTTDVDTTSTFRYQLEAFRDAVEHRGPVVTGPAEAVAAMRAVDAIYVAAGLAPRAAAEVAR